MAAVYPRGMQHRRDGSVADMEHYLGEMHRHGANFGRVWLNTGLFEIETRYGEVDSAVLVRVSTACWFRRPVRHQIKFCIESFAISDRA